MKWTQSTLLGRPMAHKQFLLYSLDLLYYINHIPSLPFPINQSIYNKSLNDLSCVFFLSILLCLTERAFEGSQQELANYGEVLVEPEEEKNKWVVRALYEALNSRDVETVHRLLAPDIEWWFHGPPARQHMMRLLTGASPEESFVFVPRSIEAFGNTVLVEGTDNSSSLYWVHAWTVTDGVITQVREYFNTSVTVTRVGTHVHNTTKTTTATPAAASSSVASSSKRTAAHCLPVWQSKLPDRAGKSLPGLVLAI